MQRTLCISKISQKKKPRTKESQEVKIATKAASLRSLDYGHGSCCLQILDITAAFGVNYKLSGFSMLLTQHNSSLFITHIALSCKLSGGLCSRQTSRNSDSFYLKALPLPRSLKTFTESTKKMKHQRISHIVFLLFSF